MDRIPTIDPHLLRCFSLGDPNEDALRLLTQLLEAGNVDWMLVVIRNPDLASLQDMASDDEALGESEYVDWPL